MSLAIFAALVAAITVVASMTVVGAVGLLFYSAMKQPGEEELEPAPAPAPEPSYEPAYQTLPPSTFQGQQQRLNTIDARHLVGYFDDEDSSLARYDDPRRHALSNPPAAQWETPNQDPAFGTPGWTEEEGATEIFAANNQGELSDFGMLEEEPTRIARGR